MKYGITVVFLFIIVLQAKSQLRVGEQAPEISLPSTNDSIMHLSSFKGKIVLIDFWASWCRPCKYSNLRVEKLYENYKDSGFEVLGISIDDRKSDWLKAIKQDRITYKQVNDKKGWKAESTRLYNVNAIPTKFLLDKTGKIVAIDPSKDQLENKILDLLKNNQATPAVPIIK